MKMSRLIPMQPVRNLEVSIDFYQKLGFSVEHRNDGWGWAMLRFDECRLMLDRSINSHPSAPRMAIVYLYPENVQEFHKSAINNGLAIPEIDTTFYGMTEFRLDDPDGNRLWVGQNRESNAGAA